MAPISVRSRGVAEPHEHAASADAAARAGRRATMRRVPARSCLGSGGEIGHQLYKELGAGKLNGVDFQSVPADEAQGAG